MLHVRYVRTVQEIEIVVYNGRLCLCVLICIVIFFPHLQLCNFKLTSPSVLSVCRVYVRENK